MRTILVTGFEPFGGQDINASWQSVQGLPEEIEGVRILKCQLPCVYYESTRAVEASLKPEITDIVLVGEAGGRSRITLELVGVNIDDTNAPDNKGVIREFQRIVPSGPDGYLATIPLKPLLEYLKAKSVPASLSCSAGLFVCNHTLFGVSHLLSTQKKRSRVGFVHVPYMSEQAAMSGTSGQSCAELTRGLKEIVTFLAKNPQAADSNEWPEELIH